MNHHMTWAGDFNRHHPMWDRDEDVHLFTQQAERAAEKLIDLLSDHDMLMLLPKGIPTLQHMCSKNYSTPDNVFGTPGLQGFVTCCEVDPSVHPACTDHFPIVTYITIPQSQVKITPNYNFRDTDWDVFQKRLTDRLSTLPPSTVITNEDQLNSTAKSVTDAIQETIKECVKCSNPRPDAKRWRNSDLKKMKRQLNRV
jgi:hypothetical protein